jgi:hypothetical protein
MTAETVTQERSMSDPMATELETLLYTALKIYPCRCAYTRAPNGQAVFKEGERILERRCSRCIAVAIYEQA